MNTSAGAADAGANESTKNQLIYRERLYVPWWGWPLPLIGATLLAAEIHLGYPGVRSWLPYVVLLPLVVALIVLLGRVQVAVAASEEGSATPDGLTSDTEDTENTELRVGDARLPVRFVGRMDVIQPKDKRKALGPQLDPAAFVVHRGWVGPMLRIQLTDPADPTPYWLFSTRKPEALAELLSLADQRANS